MSEGDVPDLGLVPDGVPTPATGSEIPKDLAIQTHIKAIGMILEADGFDHALVVTPKTPTHTLITAQTRSVQVVGSLDIVGVYRLLSEAVKAVGRSLGSF